MFYFIYNLAAAFGFLIGLPFLPILWLLGPRYYDGLSQRLGLYSAKKIGAVAGARPVWIHASSVGEVRSAGRFIDELKKALPARKIVLSTFTSTGNRMARELGLADVVLFLPLDVGPIVRHAFTRIDPSLLILIETELWPNLLRQAYRRGIPAFLLSGRLSERGFKKYFFFRRFFRQVARCFTAVGMQSRDDAERIIRLGVEASRVTVTGNLKRASAAGQRAVENQARRRKLLLIVGSSHRGEEKILLQVFAALKPRFPDLQMVLAPRHPERFAEVERLLNKSGVKFERKSQVNGRVGFGRDVVFLDTLGELESFYAIGDVAFVGGSLVDAGGHNLLEPASYGKPVLFGPYMSNFGALAAEMKDQGGGIEVHGADDLIREIGDLLADPERRKRMGERAYAVAADDRGVLDRSVGLVARYF